MKPEVKPGELGILIVAAVMSFAANLPEQYLHVIDRKMLLSTLVALVVVAMFRYLQVLLLLTISILAIGANLPAELASALGISQTAAIMSLGALIAIGLLNRAWKVLPMNREANPDEPSDPVYGPEEMMAAVAAGDQAAVHRLLLLNVGANFSLYGTTPLHVAAESGYPEIVRLLISYGADYRRKDAQGKTALELAQIKKPSSGRGTAARPGGASYGYGQGESRRGDAEMWQTQY